MSSVIILGAGYIAIFCLLLNAVPGFAAARGGEVEIRFNCENLTGTWVGESGEGDDRYAWKVRLRLLEKRGDYFRFETAGEFFDAENTLESTQRGYDICDGKVVSSAVSVEGGELDGLSVEWEYRIINLNRNDFVYQYLDGSGNGPVFRSRKLD